LDFKYALRGQKLDSKRIVNGKIFNLFVNSASIIAVLSFLWFRKGRLWSFYDTLLYKSIPQIKANSLDSDAWKKIEHELSNELQTIFNCLFRFESIYLQNRINSIYDKLWISDAEANNERHRQYTDKEQYCKYIVRTELFADFRFCGLFLFIRSIIQTFKSRLSNRDNRDKGNIETKMQ